MLPETNKTLSQGFVDDMAKQVYNTMKILYTFEEHEKEKIVKQLINDFLKQYIKQEDHAIIEKSSGD